MIRPNNSVLVEFAYADCCQRWHQGATAPTPQALMRSRYSAYVLRKADYLQATWHPQTRPGSLDLGDSPDWLSLQIVDASTEGDQGQVHFRAVYAVASGFEYLEEVSDFVRVSGRWLYLRGKTKQGRLAPGRNEPCPCGSGKKYKACCL